MYKTGTMPTTSMIYRRVNVKTLIGAIVIAKVRVKSRSERFETFMLLYYTHTPRNADPTKHSEQSA